MATGTTSARPRVVIADVHVSDSFREFDAALRRRGVDVVYLRPAHVGPFRAVKRGVDRLSGPSLPLDPAFVADPHRAHGQRAEVLSAPTVDVHATEPTLARLSLTPEWRANAALRKVGAGIDFGHVLDKLDMALLAQRVGVGVPRTSTHLETDRWPVVVKGRHGAGGMTVRIVHDPDELATAVGEISDAYLERFHPGGTLGTCGVARAGEILVQGAYERAASPHEPLGPPVRVRLIDDAAATDASTTLIRALGYTGIWCLNFVRDDDGAPLLIDVNVRAFGSWLSLDDAGIPILDAYLHLLGLGPAVSAPEPGTGPWLDVARVGVHGGASASELLRASAATSRLVWSRQPRLGWGWTVSTQLRVAQSAVGGAVGRRVSR